MNYEAFDTDYNEMQDLLVMSVKDTVSRENAELISALENEDTVKTARAIALADAVEDFDEDLSARLHCLADNPNTESFFDLVAEAESLLVF